MKFKQMWLSLDAFGTPISLNYKGSNSYKTSLGAFLTLSLRGFMLTLIILGLLEVLEYSDPQITHVRNALLRE